MSTARLTIETTSQSRTPRTGLLCGLVLLSSSSLAFLTGCGLGSAPTTSATTALAIHGRAFGGAQPLKNAAITLYAASQTGYAGASAVLTTTATDAAGNFDITGTYTCPANSQVYIVSAGGDPGTGKNNPNLVLAAGLGTCSGTLNPNLYITLNEITTVATAYALAGFSTDVSHVGTSATNVVGLANSMLTVNNLVDIGNGVARSITPAYANKSVANTNTSIVPQATLNTLGDILTTCVNSSGGAAGDGSGCGNLFASIAATDPKSGQKGPVTTDTFQAALAIAQHPGLNVAGIYADLAPLVGSAFVPSLNSQPNDWTMSITFIGGGLGGSRQALSGAFDLKVDALGNIWIPGYLSNRIIELDNLGAPLSPSTVGLNSGGYAGVQSPSAIAIDLEGGAWIAQAGSVAAMDSTGTLLANSPFTDNSMPYTNGITIDGLDNVWVPVPFNNNDVVKLDHTGKFRSGTGFRVGIATPTGGIAIDGAENAYVINGNSTIAELTNAGDLISAGSAANKVSTPGNKIALDSQGHEFIPQAGTSNTILKAVGTTGGSLFNPSSVFVPAAVAMDGGGNVWAANAGGQPKTGPAISANVVQLSNSGVNSAPPTTGFLLNFSTAGPSGIGVDGSGNVWVSNSNSSFGAAISTVQEFIGIGVPVVTPTALAVKNNALGQKP